MSWAEIQRIIAIARTASPLYRDLYSDLEGDCKSLEEVPVLTHERLMDVAHSGDAATLFGGVVSNGVVYQSSATTGLPKATIFGWDEWRKTMRVLAAAHWRARTLRAGDIVANLCASTGAAYMFVNGAVESLPAPCAVVPIGADHDYSYIHAVCRKFGVNVIAGVNSTIVGLCSHMRDQGIVDQNVMRILGGGELLLGAQPLLLKEAFPAASYNGFMYATTEVGLVGHSELGFAHDEYRVLPELAVLEILEPRSLRRITEPHVEGLAVVTSLVRTAAPAVRVATGDKAIWLDSDVDSMSRRFAIKGRRLLRTFALRDGTELTENDVQDGIAELLKRCPIVHAIVTIREDRTEFVYCAVAGCRGDLSDDDVSEVFSSIVSRSGKPKRVGIKARAVEPTFFSERTRRKARFIEDLRQLGADKEAKEEVSAS